MRNLITAILFVCLPLTLFSAEVLEKIEIAGNERITRETILYYLSSREGGDYDEELLRRDFRVLWSTGFFSNIKMESEEGKEGKIVRIVVEENPLVKEIVNKTGKRLKKDDIVNKLKEKEEYILPYSYYSPYKIHRIKQTIKELFLEKGLTDGNIDVNLDKKGKNELEVVFHIKEGARIKVGEIVFEGTPRLRESMLYGAMKEN